MLINYFFSLNHILLETKIENPPMIATKEDQVNQEIKALYKSTKSQKKERKFKIREWECKKIKNWKLAERFKK